ncbi:DUF4283 domain-containing protein, partial [Cephalotus follicularis]
GLAQPATVGSLDPRHIAIQLQSSEDLSHAWSRVSRIFHGKSFLLLRWSPAFKSHDSPLAAIWMRLPGLTLPLHNPSLLKAIGDSLGSFLRTDDATLKFKNPRSARICVEMDLSVPPPPAFVATFGELKFQQSIIYESRLLYCSHCRLQGHCAQTCRNCKRKHVAGPSSPVKRPGKEHCGLPAGASRGPPILSPPLQLQAFPKHPQDVCGNASVTSPLSKQPHFRPLEPALPPLQAPAMAISASSPLVGDGALVPGPLAPPASPPSPHLFLSSSNVFDATGQACSLATGPPLIPRVGSGQPHLHPAHQAPPAPTHVPSLPIGLPLVPSLGQAQSAPSLGPSQPKVLLASTPLTLGPCPSIHVLAPNPPSSGPLPLGPSVLDSASLPDHPPVSLVYSAPSNPFEHCLSSCPLPPLSSFDPMSLEQSLPPV